MAEPSRLQYTPLPERAQEIVDNLVPPTEGFEEELAKYKHIHPPTPNKEGDIEIIDDVSFTHHFIDGPGDAEVVKWHYVSAGSPAAEPLVFLHGIPESWFQYAHVIAHLSSSFHCIAIDLKGYGQSSTLPGDYTHEGASNQLYAMLQLLHIARFNLVTHDRGTVQGDFLAANHPSSIIRYIRGEQHLYHYHPSLSPQDALFRNAPYTGLMADPTRFVVWVHSFARGPVPIPEKDVARTIQEFSHEGVTRAVPRYFNSSSFRAEWLERRNRLLEAWTCPALILQGYDSRTQPREFYEKAREYIPNAERVEVKYITGGHFWTLESPKEVAVAIEEFVKGTGKG